MADRLPQRNAAQALAGFALVFVVTALVLAWLHSATDSLYGYDGYFHIRYAEVLRSEGVSRSFPWWQETFLRDRFADKEFLFHVLLIPFTFGDLMAGGKLAAILFGAAAAGAFYLVARALRVPWPLAWALGLVASSTAFLYRLGFTRPLVAAVTLALAGTAAILLRRKRWAFALAALYPHLHISYHLLPCVALLHDLHARPEEGGRRSFRLAGWTAAGAAAGTILTPYFPNNLTLWWVQNIRVLALAWTGPSDLGMGLEIRPGLSSQLLGYNLGVFLALGAAIYLMARTRGRISSDALTLLVISAGFLALAMMSRRFIEFWAPFTLLLAGVAVRDYLHGRRAETGSPPEGSPSRPPGAGRRRPGMRWVVAGAAGILVAGLSIHNARSARRIIKNDGGATYAGASEWMRANVRPGEKIFQLDWDDFPQLFFFNPQFRYLVGLDPAFMYVTDPDHWRLWQEITHAEVEDLFGKIRQEFGSRWVFGIHDAEDFVESARRDPRFFPRYEDMNVTVFFLADGFRFLDRWNITGWYPNPSRRLFDATLRPEPSVPGRPQGPRATGIGSEGTIVTTGPGFQDLTRALAVPPGSPRACAVARTDLSVPGGAGVTIGLTTDDEHRLYLNGLELDSRSPLLEPPPGSPGGPAVSIDDLDQVPRRVEERWIEVTPREGANELILKICQVGEDFGFFLRAFTADGTNLPSSPAGAP
jgi:hypothetical protein